MRVIIIGLEEEEKSRFLVKICVFYQNVVNK